MDEYGETPTFFIWPQDHEPGDPLPEDFNSRVYAALSAAGFASESF